MRLSKFFQKDKKQANSNDQNINGNSSKSNQPPQLKAYIKDPKDESLKLEHHDKDSIYRTCKDTIKGELHLSNYADLYNISVRCTFLGETGVRNNQDILLPNTDSIKVVAPFKWKRGKKETKFHIEEFFRKDIYLFGNEIISKTSEKQVENGLTRGKHVFPFKIDLAKYEQLEANDSVWFISGFLNYQLLFEVVSEGQVLKKFGLNVILNSINVTCENESPTSFGKHLKNEKNEYKLIVRTDKNIYDNKETMHLSYGLKLLTSDLNVVQNSSTLLSNIGLIATLYRYIKIDKPNSKVQIYNQKISQTFSPLILNKHKFTKDTVNLKFDNKSQHMPSIKTKLFSISYYVELNICFKYLTSIKTVNNEVIKLGSFENISNVDLNIDPHLLAYKIKEDFLERRGSQDLVQDDLKMVITSNFLKPDAASQKERIKVVVKCSSKEDNETDKDESSENESTLITEKFDYYESVLSGFTFDNDESDMLEEEAPDFY